MTSTPRAFVASAFATPLVGTCAMQTQEATPTAGGASDPVQVLNATWSMIDLIPYAADWRPGESEAIGVFARSDDAVMDGFDLESGERLWSTDLRAAFPEREFAGGGFSLSPRSGTSVAIGHSGSADLFAVDATTGEALWHVSMNSAEGLAGNMSQSFALTGGRIVGMSSRSHLFSLDERTADIQWETKLPTERLWDAINPPVVSDTAAYLVDDVMRIHAVSMESGELAWTREMEPADQFVTMQTFGDAVLANLEWEGVRRLDPDSGEDLWTNPDFLPYRHAVTDVDGHLVIGMQPTMHMITAIDLASGETAWKREPDASSVEIVAQASNRSLLAIADADDRVTVLDARSGEEVYVIEELRLGLAYPQSARVLAMTEDWLFVATDNQRIAIVDLASGSIVSRMSLVGITDGLVPVSLWPVGGQLVAHAPRLRIGIFTMLS